ncbi:899_t:CDS:1, partial [Ambispora leptoticha]
KITAHSNNIFNDTADSLAKSRNHTTDLEFLHSNIYNPSYYLQYKTYAFEQPIRKSIKNICNSYIIAMWSSQHRMENIIPLVAQID